MVLEITLVLKEVPVKITHSDGTVHDYKLKELIGKDRDSYLTSMAGNMKYDEKGKPAGFKSFQGLNSSLLCRTLYNDKDKLVSEELINEFPASSQGTLFEHSQKLSDMDISGEGKEDTKKD